MYAALFADPAMGADASGTAPVDPASVSGFPAHHIGIYLLHAASRLAEVDTGSEFEMTEPYSVPPSTRDDREIVPVAV